MRKTLSIALIILLLSTIFVFYFEKNSEASYSSKFANYPGYEELIEHLQKEYPNWEFEIYETGLDWSDVLEAETVARHGRSLISKKSSLWNCATCGSKQYEPGWYCASIAAVAYYLDPRNSICEDYIFQFEQLTYDSTNQTKEGVEKILADCDYMQGKITYYDTKGAKKTINKTYVDVIMEAAKTYDVSPYHIASRIRQEIGTGEGSVIVSGTYGSYKGYYNYFNWGAFGDDIIGSGLKTAKDKGWTDPEKAIKGGVEAIAKNYISIGQDTFYFQKFDVVDGGDGYYGHQYMTNVSASKTEGQTVRSAYKSMGLLSKDVKIKFKIPVYKNMPTIKAAEPGKETIITQDVQINENSVNIRKTASISGAVLKTLNKGTKLLRIELAEKKDSDGYYWDKVVLSDGSKGYVSRTYLTELSLQSNCNEKYVVLNEVALRNGPGTSGTEIIKYISPGKIITAVEKGKYPNLNGESWYRVKLTDGSCGYVAIGSEKDPNIDLYDETNGKYDYVEVICTDGLNIRSAPTTSGNNIITSVVQGTELFRIQKEASTNGGYIWDKIVTQSGIVGYVVRQDKETGEAWIKSLNTVKYVVEDKEKSVVCVPGLTAEGLKALSDDIVVKNGDKTVAKDAKIGTGYTITIDGKTYTAVVKGDVNGDGLIKATDYMKIKNYIMKTSKLTGAELLAADVNNNDEIKATDYMKIKNYIMGTSQITLD